MKTVILLSGKKETGKSTAASFFVESGGVEQSFAAELKDQLFVFTKYILGADVTYDHFQKQELKIKPITIPYVDKEITPRYLMQKYGTEIMRDMFNDNYWVDRVISKIIKAESDFHIISDCRFPNEIDRIKDKLNGVCHLYTLRVNRNTGKNDNHPSETSLDDYQNWDFLIDNNYSKDAYFMNLTKIYQHIKEGVTEKWTQQFFC